MLLYSSENNLEENAADSPLYWRMDPSVQGAGRLAAEVVELPGAA